MLIDSKTLGFGHECVWVSDRVDRDRAVNLGRRGDIRANSDINEFWKTNFWFYWILKTVSMLVWHGTRMGFELESFRKMEQAKAIESHSEKLPTRERELMLLQIEKQVRTTPIILFFPQLISHKTKVSIIAAIW